MALIHDVSEIISGDMDPTDRTITPEEKRRREYEAFDQYSKGMNVINIYEVV